MGEKEEKDEKEDISKKCAQTGTTLKRARRYYRDGKYFINKRAYKEFSAQLKKDSEEAKAEDVPADKPKEEPKEESKKQAQKESKAETKQAKKEEPKKEESKAKAAKEQK